MRVVVEKVLFERPIRMRITEWPNFLECSYARCSEYTVLCVQRILCPVFSVYCALCSPYIVLFVQRILCSVFSVYCGAF